MPRTTTVRNTAELLGYSASTKLLIIHADDLGVAHSVNMATFAALEQQAITSASVMVPCPWFAEVVEYVREHPACDIGIHLTITSEWKDCKWEPLSKVDQSSGLVNQEGHLWEHPALIGARPEAIENEIRLQIEHALAAGLNPTHLDTHMLALMQRPEYFASYLNVARAFGLPAFIHSNVRNQLEKKKLLSETDVVVDFTLMAGSRIAPHRWKEFYIEMLRFLEPGLNQIIVHLGYDDSELRSVTSSQDAFGAAWRQRDFDVVTSVDFRSALQQNDIHLINWDCIRARQRARIACSQ